MCVNIKWWEKTVEYYFVRNHLTNSAIAPLDGNEEKAGDAIFGKDGLLVLIEFKKDAAALKSEENKFRDYPSAKENLENRDEHHFMIYGADGGADEMQNNQLKLNATTYFSKRSCAIPHALKKGKTPKDFNQYLSDFIKYKKEYSGAGGGGAGDFNEEYGLVAMIKDNGEIDSCIPLSAYIQQMNMAPKQDPKMDTDSSHAPR